MAIDVYINFKGNCREAVEFYAQVFGTEKPKFMTFGEAPADPSYTVPEDTKDLIMHTRLNINGSNVMFSDTPDEMPYVQGNNVTLVISSKDIDEIKALYEKLKVDGIIYMELQETFWSKSYANLVDKYGIGWQLSHDDGRVM